MTTEPVVKIQDDSLEDEFVLVKPSKSFLQTETFTAPGGSAKRQSPSVTIRESVEQLDNFAALGLPEWQVETLKSLAITRPTAIQTACIPEILKGCNVIGGAKTGSGKTAAFALPILQRLAEDPFGPFALIITPTRELALQIAEQFQVLGRTINATVCVVFGGVDMMKQTAELARRPHVIVATPGRLVDVLRSSSDCLNLKGLRFCVLDEADRLLDPLSTFQTLGEIPTILQRVQQATSCQTLLFSATLTKSVEDYLLLERESAAASMSTVTSPTFIFRSNEDFGTVESIAQKYLLVPSQVRDCYLFHLLENDLKGRSMIIFVSKCFTAELLRFWLREMDIEVAALHSQLAQVDRIAALARFKSGQLPILISTDVGSRGLDIPSVEVVINYDVPLDARDYVHRIGRTARAGRSGFALTLMSEMDVELIENIEAKIGRQLEEFSEPKEEQVLEHLNRVSEAKRKASMTLADRKFGAKREHNKRKWQKLSGDEIPKKTKRNPKEQHE